MREHRFQALSRTYRSSRDLWREDRCSKQQNDVVAGVGTVAELIDGDHPAAVSYLRKRFGGMLRATTDAEALASQRSLTQDGMIVQSGEYDRIKPIAKDL